MSKNLGIVATVALLVSLASCLDQRCGPANGTTTPHAFSQIQFDYVIIGGGTAGLALASRLAENDNIQIGVLEAGNFHQNDPLIDIPQNMGAPFGNPSYDWNFVTLPQPGAANKTMAATRGKILGGSSALNFLAWTRASKIEYDAWQSFVPGSTWNWDGLLPYFKKSSSVLLNQTNLPLHNSDDPSSINFEGIDGPVMASFNDVYPDPVQNYIDSVHAIGISSNSNPDNGNTIGLTNARSSIDRKMGVRSYAAPAYYCRSVNRKNFHVLMNSQATKIILRKGSTGKMVATGVQFISGSNTYTAQAKQEVILAAGVYQSPQILELSGIGNQKILQKVGIKTLIDLPSVGENLQDHLASEVQYQLKEGVVTFDSLRNNATFATEQAIVYNQSRGGFLAASNSILTFVPFQTFLDRPTITSILDTFDKSISLLNPSVIQRQQYSIQRQWIEQGNVPQLELILFNSGFINPIVNTSYITIVAGQMHHLNRGNVHINTSIPNMAPIIDPRWLNNDFDVSIGLQGIKLSTLIASQRPATDIIKSKTNPAPNVQSESALTDYFRQTVGSFDHPMGTNAMASRELGGVVDAHLKVYGTSNLRICDASIIPMGVGTHLQSTVYAIAEKLADMIKQHQ